MIDEDSELAPLKDTLVAANRILLHHEIVDAFGHVSARHPRNPDIFLMSRRIAPGLVSVADIRQFGLDGELLVKDGTQGFLERYIHSAIYAVRPDVNAVVHSHSENVIAFSVVASNPLRPVCHTCGFIRKAAPVFEISAVSGPASDLLIRNQALGAALAATLQNSNVVLMRGHGSTTVGASVQQAVYRAVYTEINAKVQAAASALGRVRYLSEEEADAVETGASIQIERTWDFWMQQVQPAASDAQEASR